MRHFRPAIRSALFLFLVPAMLATPTALAQEETAMLTVIHAVPAADGFPADVYLAGELVIDAFIFETASDTFEVPAGELDLAIYPQGANPDTEDPALESTVTLDAGGNFTLVAQLLDGEPVLTLFVNDTSQIAAGSSRLTVRQTSGVASLDVTLDGNELFFGLAPPDEASTEVVAGDHEVTLLTAGDPLSQTIALGEGRLTVLYAVGSAEDGTFNLLSQTVLAAQTDPTGVPTGTGGDKAAAGLMPGLVLGLIALAALGGIRARRILR